MRKLLEAAGIIAIALAIDVLIESYFAGLRAERKLRLMREGLI